MSGGLKIEIQNYQIGQLKITSFLKNYKIKVVGRKCITFSTVDNSICTLQGMVMQLFLI
jgi:hypothetical protein